MHNGAYDEKYIFCSAILEAVDWYKTYHNCMLKTSDFLNKILLPREIHNTFTKSSGAQP